MNILSVEKPALSGLVVFTYSRYPDARGYFTETFNNTSLGLSDNTGNKIEFVQSNESFSHTDVVRGLHFQWNPYMGKLIRTVYGHMVDLVVDVRPDSPTFGKGMMFDMPAAQTGQTDKLLWIPPGFAHGNFFLDDTLIQYFCTGTYNPAGEACIRVFDEAIDWSMAEGVLIDKLHGLKPRAIQSQKDKAGIALHDWRVNENSKRFTQLL